MFAGRREVLRTLIRSIEDQRLHVVVFGDRGIGKTSLLHLLSNLAREAHYHVSYHSCGERDDFAETFREIAREIPLLYDARHNPSADETTGGASLANLLPQGDYAVSQLTDVFSHLSNTRLVVILDEFDRSPPGEFRRRIAEFIKNASDRSLRVQVVIGGVATSLPELVEHIPSIRRNIVGLPIPAMTPEEVAEVIAIGQRISGVRYSPSAVQLMTLIANGSPYLASMIAQYSGFNAVDANTRDVDVRHVVDAAKQVASELRGRMSKATVGMVENAIADGAGKDLVAYARSSLSSMGQISLDGQQGDVETRIKEIAEKYPALIQPVADATHTLYRFTEDGLPLYLWISYGARPENAMPTE